MKLHHNYDSNTMNRSEARAQEHRPTIKGSSDVYVYERHFRERKIRTGHVCHFACSMHTKLTRMNQSMAECHLYGNIIAIN